MISQDFALQLLNKFSLLTVGESKTPNFKWGNFKENKISEDEFIKRYNYKGGISFEKNGEKIEIPATKNIGFVCGYDGLECIDVDLKVLSTNKEKEDFWNEYLSLLKDSIYDFDNKIVVYKTLNGGYHLLYKTNIRKGNSDIAKLKGHTSQLIETRGYGGYIFAYPDNKVGKLSYFDIQYITDEERNIIWNISKSYNYEEKPKEKPPYKAKKEFKGGELKPWDDFNNQTDVWDVVSDDFTIPHGGHKNKFTIIKRHGATSPHSGYIYHDSGCMYLFSTGTIYPAEKLITPYHAFTIKFHNGDFTASAKDLYEQGFGDRVQYKEIEKEIELEIKEEIKIENADFPIDVFPPLIQNYIKECNEKMQLNTDYMACSLLFLISIITGNGYKVKVKNGWEEIGCLWLSLVGRAGVGKTPSISAITHPIDQINGRNLKRYIEEKKKFDEYNQLSKKEKKEIYGENYEYPEPKKHQFIVNDITLEALIDLHQDVPLALGVNKDELAGWIKDMNKYRAGSDVEFWLSSWSGKGVTVNRMTRSSNYVQHPFISVLGGIQPSIFDNLSTEDNKENGFMDRLLISYPEAVITEYVDEEVDERAIQWYKEVMQKFYYDVKANLVTKDGEIVPLVVEFSKEAKKEWVRVFNKITELQNSDFESEYMKTMLPKQKAYIPRFALLIHLFDSFFKGWDGVMHIEKESILKAEKLSDYFIKMAKKVKFESNESKELKSKIENKKTKKEQIFEAWSANNDVNKTKLAELLGVSRKTIYQYIKAFEK